jgi:hypothetical protein
VKPGADVATFRDALALVRQDAPRRLHCAAA